MKSKKVKTDSVSNFSVDDVILPDIKLSNPCWVEIVITRYSVMLTIDRRDWRWDRKTGELTDTGTFLGN